MKKLIILFLLIFTSNCFADAIAQWKMNDDADNANIVDSVASYTGTFVGTGETDDYTSAHQVGDANGQINGAIEYDGTNDYITVDDADAFTPDGTAFSIIAWVSLSADEGALDFEIANKNGTALEWAFSIGGDQLQFSLYDESAGKTTIGRLDTTTNYALYEGSGFIFVAGTYDGGSSSEGIRLYLHDQRVDDTDNNSGTFSNVDNSDEVITMGKTGDSYAKGIIDNVVIFDAELTLAQIEGFYNDGIGTEDITEAESATENSIRPRFIDGYRGSYRSRYK